MKRLRPAHIIVAVLLFAASAIATSAFALPYDCEQHVTYYENGEVVGAAVSSACYGWNWSWGQRSGDLKLEKLIKCDDGSVVYCRWYQWTGSQWELIAGAGCGSAGTPERPPRPLP